MRKILSCALLALILCVFHIPRAAGQISLNSDNYPVDGLYINRGYCFSAPGVLGSPGGNQFYDFTNIFPLDHDTVKYWDAAQTLWSGFHPGATVVSAEKKGPISVVSFYTIFPGAFCRTGLTYIGDFGQGLDTAHANLLSPDTLIADNFTYAYSGTQFSKATFVNFLPLANFQTITKRIISIDGWGSLETPLNFYSDVLRVKSTEFLYDTAFYLGAPIYTYSDTLYNILFYAQDVRHPVIKAHTDSAFNLIYFEYIFSPPVIIGCMDSTAVNFNPLANQPDSNCIYCNINFSITPDTTICPGASLDLSIIGGTTYLWSTGDTTDVIQVSPVHTTTYSVYITDGPDCHVLASVKVSVDEAVTASFWTAHNTYNIGDSVQFINLSDNATYYNWDFDDPPGGYSSIEFPKYAYTSTGSKNVILYAGNLCYEDSAVSFITILSPSFVSTQNADDRFIIYPNPGTDFLNLEGYLENDSGLEIAICDMLGRTIYRTESKSFSGEYALKVDVSEFPSGIYLVVIKTSGSTIGHRWMKSQ